MNPILAMIRAGVRRTGFDVVRYRRVPLPPADLDARDVAIWNRVRDYTMTSPERVAALARAVRYVVRAEIPGAIVECGVAWGGSIMAAALALLECGVRDRELWLYDTFEGMTPPGPEDVTGAGVTGTELFEQYTLHGRRAWYAVAVDEVGRNVWSTGYPMDQVHMVKGRVEDRLPGVMPAKMALLRLDTDWYQSTKHELVHLYPLLSPGGVLLLDDYGGWRGSRKAADEYLPGDVLLCRIDQRGCIAVKPARGGE